MSATSMTVRPRTGRRLRPRHLWLVPGIAVAIAANELGEANGVGIVALLALGIAPDVPRLLGYRGRPAHDLLHQPALVAAAVAVAALAAVASVLPIAWLVGSLIWLGHVIAGRGVNDVPRGGGARA